MLVQLPNGRWVRAEDVRSVTAAPYGSQWSADVREEGKSLETVASFPTREEAAAKAADIAYGVNEALCRQRHTDHSPGPGEYDVLTRHDPEVLAKMVQSRLDQGWELHGITLVAGGKFHQAMTRVVTAQEAASVS